MQITCFIIETRHVEIIHIRKGFCLFACTHKQTDRYHTTAGGIDRKEITCHHGVWSEYCLFNDLSSRDLVDTLYIYKLQLRKKAFCCCLQKLFSVSVFLCLFDFNQEFKSIYSLVIHHWKIWKNLLMKAFSYKIWYSMITHSPTLMCINRWITWFNMNRWTSNGIN